MSDIAEKFHSLSLINREPIKIEACRVAYSKWLESAKKSKLSVEIDLQLPLDAIEAICRNRNDMNIESRYKEPISSIQSGQLDFGENYNLMYFSISNFHEQKFYSLKVGDWTILNQAYADLSKLEFESALSKLLMPSENA